MTSKAEAKLAEMNDEIVRLQKLRLTLRKMVEACGGECMRRAHRVGNNGDKMEVVIYTNTGCSACHQAKEFLTQHNVSFVEKASPRILR